MKETKYREEVLNRRQVATAIFEYLQRRHKKPNRKRGVELIQGLSWGLNEAADSLSAWVWVKK